MPTQYYEFDATPATLIEALRTRILGIGATPAGTDWTDISVTGLPSTTTSGAMSTSSVPLTSTTGFAVGQVVAIGTDANREYRILTAVSSTNISWTGVNNLHTHPTGDPVVAVSAIFKNVAPNGAQIVLDLLGAATLGGPATHAMNVNLFRQHDGTTGVDKVSRGLAWKSTATVMTDPVHIILSVGPGHIYLSIEGPRGGESGADNINGSYRQTLGVCELVPYFTGGPAAVVVIGHINTGASAADVLCHVSRNHENTSSWVPARLATLQPALGGVPPGGAPFGLTRRSVGDGKDYLWPYVVVETGGGLRGRLKQFHYAGITVGSANDPTYPVGERYTFESVNYIGLSPFRAVSGSTWSAFGATDNSAAVHRSPIVAVPLS